MKMFTRNYKVDKLGKASIEIKVIPPDECTDGRGRTFVRIVGFQPNALSFSAVAELLKRKGVITAQLKEPIIAQAKCRVDDLYSESFGVELAVSRALTKLLWKIGEASREIVIPCINAYYQESARLHNLEHPLPVTAA